MRAVDGTTTDPAFEYIMTRDTPFSRRDSLKGIVIATTLGGATLAGVSIADRDDDAAHDGHEEDTDDGQEKSTDDRKEPNRADDPGDVRLVPLCTEPDLDLAVFRIENHTKETVTVEWKVVTDDEPEPRITFPDCETVTVRGDFADVITNVIWWDEEGLVGTISEPIGPVDGERTVNVDEFFGIDPAAGPVVESAEAFEEGTPVMPGGGDIIRENPDAQACVDDALAELDGSETAPASQEDETGVLDGETGGERTLSAGDTSVILAHAPDGTATVSLVWRGEQVDVADSDPDRRCRDGLAEPTEDGELSGELDREDMLAVLDEYELPAEVDEKSLRKAIHAGDVDEGMRDDLHSIVREWLDGEIES